MYIYIKNSLKYCLQCKKFKLENVVLLSFVWHNDVMTLPLCRREALGLNPWMYRLAGRGD